MMYGLPCFRSTGRWSKADVRSWIHFNRKVHDVKYNDSTDDFTVLVKDLVQDVFLPAQTFDYVIIATGHFSVPNVPDFPGLKKFPGRVMHSHNFRDAREFKGKRVLLVGASYSAEDLALQLLKYAEGANIITCYRTKPMGFKWPPKRHRASSAGEKWTRTPPILKMEAPLKWMRSFYAPATSILIHFWRMTIYDWRLQTCYSPTVCIRTRCG